MQIIDDQERPFPMLSELGQDPLAGSCFVEVRCRRQLLPVNRCTGCLPDCGKNGKPELLGVLLVALHLDDCQPVALAGTGTTTWFSGKATCVPYISAFAIGSPGDWKMAGLHANGQLGAAAYRRGDDGGYHPFAVVVLATTATHLKRISLFTDPALFARFDLPAVLPPR